jgi:hypothetical protein
MIRLKKDGLGSTIAIVPGVTVEHSATAAGFEAKWHPLIDRSGVGRQQRDAVRKCHCHKASRRSPAKHLENGSADFFASDHLHRNELGSAEAFW